MALLAERADTSMCVVGKDKNAGSRPPLLLDILDVEQIMSGSHLVTKFGDLRSVDRVGERPGPKSPGGLGGAFRVEDTHHTRLYET